MRASVLTALHSWFEPQLTRHRNIGININSMNNKSIDYCVPSCRCRRILPTLNLGDAVRRR